MAIPKHKPQEQPPLDVAEDTGPGPGLDDLVDDPELLAEMKQWEEASLQDFLKFEQSLDSDEEG